MCKVRVIKLNYSASQTVSFDGIKSLILGRGDTETVTDHIERKINRKRADIKIHIFRQPENKVYRVSFLKRWRLCDNTSVLFSFV